MSLGQSSFINAPILYINDLELAWFSPTSLTVQTGRARDVTNNFDINLGASITINGARNGANALDKGVLVANTWYRVFILYASTGSVAPCCILSTDFTPLFPNNQYDYYKRIGWVKTDGSANFLQFSQAGNGSVKTYQWRTFINVLTNGQSESFAPIDLSSALPPSFRSNFAFAITFYSTLGQNFGAIRPSGSDTAFTACPIRFYGVASANPVFPTGPYLSMIPGLASGVPTVEYILDTNTHLNMDVLGFTDYI